MNPFRSLHQLLKRIGSCFSQELPKDRAFCEFECRKTECKESHWESCPRRHRDIQDHS